MRKIPRRFLLPSMGVLPSLDMVLFLLIVLSALLPFFSHDKTPLDQVPLVLDDQAQKSSVDLASYAKKTAQRQGNRRVSVDT